MKLVQEAQLTHLHVFPYSERPGTPAAKMSQIPVTERKARATTLRNLGNKMQEALLKSMIGQTVPVLVESDGRGWTENYLHVILNRKCSSGKIVSIKIKGVKDHALVG